MCLQLRKTVLVAINIIYWFDKKNITTKNKKIKVYKGFDIDFGHQEFNFFY